MVLTDEAGGNHDDHLGGPGVAHPDLIARAIERTTPDIDVLGVWNESPHGHEPAPKPSQLVFGVADEAMPDVCETSGAGRGPNSTVASLAYDDVE